MACRVLALVVLALAATAGHAKTTLYMRGPDGKAMQPSELDSRIVSAIGSRFSEVKIGGKAGALGVKFDVDTEANKIKIGISTQQAAQKTMKDKTTAATQKELEVSMMAGLSLVDYDFDFEFSLKFAATFSQMWPSLTDDITAKVKEAMGGECKTLQEAADLWAAQSDAEAKKKKEAFTTAHPILAYILDKMHAGLTFSLEIGDGKTLSGGFLFLDPDNKDDEDRSLPTLKLKYQVDDHIGFCVGLFPVPTYTPNYCDVWNQGLALGFKFDGFSKSSFIAAIWPLVLPLVDDKGVACPTVSADCKQRTITDYLKEFKQGAQQSGDSAGAAKLGVQKLATDIKAGLPQLMANPAVAGQKILNALFAAISNPSITARLAMHVLLADIGIEQTINIKALTGSDQAGL